MARIESSVTSISWIPSEAVEGASTRPFFEIGVSHYDAPPPDRIVDPEELRAADRFRFANRLHAYIDVEGGGITGYGHLGGGLVGSTTMRVLGARATFAGVAMPDIRPDPVVGPASVRFVQTAGGRTGCPAPRRVNRPPFVQLAAPLAWTTLALTIHADGRSELDVVGASPFPRHWIYDGAGNLVRKTGMIDYRTWWLEAFGERTPWGAADSPALVTEVESALERRLSREIMGAGQKPRMARLRAGDTLVEQGAPGRELYLLLDGVVSVEVDGRPIAEVGPGALLGERAVLEGRRTATLRAVTPCRLAIAYPEQLRREHLAELARAHGRELEAGRPD